MNDEQLVKLTINGRQRSVRAMATTTLLTVLRDELALTGAKRGCNQGVCGACTVLVADEPVPQLPVASGEPSGSADHDR